MKNTLIKIAKVIENVARNEDDELRRASGEGIFFMPELAFAYACGKAIMMNRNEVFGGESPQWLREIDLGNGGPTDLVFQYDNGVRIAVEFKLRDKGSAYTADLDKLSRLDSKNTARVFCALIDTFNRQLTDDGRVTAIEQYNREPLVSLIEPKPTFSTVQDWYKSDVSCLVGVWALGNVPNWT